MLLEEVVHLAQLHMIFVWWFIAATSFEKSQLQPLIPLLEVLPFQHQLTIPYMLSLMTGSPCPLELYFLIFFVASNRYLIMLRGKTTCLFFRKGVILTIPKYLKSKRFMQYFVLHTNWCLVSVAMQVSD
jgi:hypothetical protein